MAVDDFNFVQLFCFTGWQFCLQTLSFFVDNVTSEGEENKDRRMEDTRTILRYIVYYSQYINSSYRWLLIYF